MSYQFHATLNKTPASQAAYESVAGKYPTLPGEPTGGLNGSALAVVVSIVTTVNNIIFETIAGMLVDFQLNKYHSIRRWRPFLACVSVVRAIS